MKKCKIVEINSKTKGRVKIESLPTEEHNDFSCYVHKSYLPTGWKFEQIVEVELKF